jgi:hypothetical protein
VEPKSLPLQRSTTLLNLKPANIYKQRNREKEEKKGEEEKGRK